MSKKKNWRSTYSGNYLKAADLPRGGKRFRIEEITEKVLREGENPKLVAQLKGGKSWVLNATNCELLEETLATDDPDEWAGKTVTLFKDATVRGPNGEKGGVRVMPPDTDDDDDEDVDADLDDLDD